MDSKKEKHQNSPNFDPTKILSETDSSLNHQEAYYLFELARKTRGTGDLVHIGNLKSAALYCFAEAAKTWGGTVSLINAQRGQMTDGSDLKVDHSDEAFVSDSMKKLGLDKYLERRNYNLSSSGWSTHVDCLFIDGCMEREALMKTILSWKKHIGRAGVIVIASAQDGGQVDQTIDESLYRDSAFIEIQGAGRIRSFARRQEKMEIILCGGLQSGGTTLVSWCFLQRPDMSGILDMWTEGLLLMPYVKTLYGWCKMTISCFRWQDVADFYADQGWTVRPLLVVRDVRSVYASLRLKPYGINGITAQDPPLKLRLKRFLRDWEEFRANDWPIIRYESLVAEPEKTLQKCCSQLDISWHADMLLWPKTASEIGGLEESNTTFQNSLSGQSFDECVIPLNKEIETSGISKEDLGWLEKTFSEYNHAYSYPNHVPQDNAALFPDRPSYRVTQYQKMFKQINILQRQLDTCKVRINELLDSKSWKITAPMRYFYRFLKKKKES